MVMMITYYSVVHPLRICNGASFVVGLQREITSWQHKFTLNKIKDNFGAKDMSGMVAAAAPKASAWLMTPPAAVLHPSDHTLRPYHRMKLGLHLVGGRRDGECECLGFR